PCTPRAVATTFLVVYTTHNTYSTPIVVITLLLVYTVPCTPSAVATTFLVVYTIHCYYFSGGVHKIYSMSTKERQTLTGHKRGQGGSAVDSAGCGHGASSARGRGARLSFFSAAGRVIEPQHAEELVEWITKPSSSSPSSITQAQNSFPANAAAKAAYPIGSMSTVTPSLAPPSCTEESPELFDHSVGYMLQEDAQRFEESDDGTQVE
ncbi:hypothetical protein AB205_0114490, partial [Aquarana catesbeiana]